eukprot:s1056_g9.t4
MADLRSTGESRKSECGTNRPNAVREELSKCEVNAVEEQRRLQARLDGVLEDRAEAQAETARSLEMLRSLCQDKELEVQEKEELLQSEKKVKESIVDELQKVLEVGTTQGALGDGSRVGWTWSEVQELRQVSQTWAASCMVQPAVRMKLFKEDQQRLNEEALNRWHQQLEGLTLCCGLICLAYLGYHVEPRWPRYWSAYSVGALSSLASGLLGLALEAHRPKETRQYSVGGIQLIAGLVMALVMPILNSVGMPLAQLAAHHFIASSTLSRLVAGSNTARSFASYIALNLWLGAFICQLSWLMVAPTPFVVVLELVMGGLMAVIPASEVKEALLGREAELLDLRRQNQEITENKATQGEAIAALEAKFQEERRAQELSLGQLEQRRSQLEDDVIKLRQEKREADGHIQNLEAKANELQGEILRLQKTSEASAAGKKAAEAKHEEAEREWLRMETQVQQLKLEARVHVTLAEEQQVVISEQREEMLKLRSQLARQSEVVPKDPREEEKNRQLRECLAMAVDELDARQAQFVLEKQRLTGALEESRRAVLGYLGVSAAHDSARVIGLEQQLASERNRCVEQAVSIQRLEHQLSQQKFYTDQAEGEPTVPAPPLLGAMADHVTVTWNKLLVQKALQIADEGISCMLTVTWLCFDLPLRALFSADEDRVPELQFLSSCDVQHENTMKALHEMGLLKHHKHHFVDILDRASHVSGNASIPTALTLTFPALPAWGPAQEESFWENWILPAKLSSPAASRCVQGCHAVVAAEPLAYFGSTTPKVRALENVTTGEIGEITEDVLWHLAVHKDWGEFVRNPAEVYKELCKALADKEFTTEEAFWLQDSAELEREVRTCKKSTKAGCSLLLGFPCRWELPMLHAFWRPEALECGAGKAVLQDPSQTGAEQRANETQAVLQDPSQTTAEQRANETQAMQDQSQTGAEQRANETQAVLQDPSQTGAEHRANETQAVLQDPSPTGAEQKENETQAVLQDPSQTTAEQMANETQEPPVSAAEQIAGESQDPSPTTAEKMKDASQVNSESNPEETEAPPTREAKRWCIFDRSVWPTLSQKIRADDEAALALNLAQQAKDTKCSQHDLLWQGVQKEASQEIYQGTKFPAARFGIVSKEPPELAVDHRDQAAALAKMFKNSIQVQESIPAKVPLVEEPGLPAKGLVSGAKIHGTVNITGSTKVSKESLAEHVAEHGVEDLTLISYETTYAWHLSSPERFKKPIPFLQKQGGRIWVNLDLPQNLAKIVALRGKASDAQDEEKLQQVIDSHHVLTNFSTYKRPFIRVRHADLDFQRKFYYVADHFESMQHAVLRAVDMAAEVAKHQDEVACMQSLELKAIATTHGLVKGGGIETLRSRVLCHKLSTSGASGGSVEISGAEMPGEKPAAKHKDNTAQKTPALEGEKVVKRRKTSSAASAAHQPVQQQKDAAGDQKESHSKKGRAGKGSTACKFFVPLACV